MAKTLTRISKFMLNQKKKRLKRELKSVAFCFVQNSRAIKRAIELKREQPSLIKDFNSLKHQLLEISRTEDDDPGEPYPKLLGQLCWA